MNVLINYRDVNEPFHSLPLVINSIIRNYRDLDTIYVASSSFPLKRKQPKVEWIYYPDEDVTNGDGKINYVKREDHINTKLYSVAFEELNLNSFIRVGDDVYFNKPVSDEVFTGPMPYKEKLSAQTIDKNYFKYKDHNNTTSWKYCLVSTLKALKDSGYPYVNYTVHCPHMVTKEEFDNALLFFESFSFQLESGVYNLSDRELGPNIDSTKRKMGYYSKHGKVPSYKDYMFVNHNDDGLTPRLKKRLLKDFSNV